MVKNLLPMQETHKICGLDPWVGDILWRRAWQPTPVFLPRESPRTEEPAGLLSTGSQRFGHNWATNTFTFIYLLTWKPFLHGGVGGLACGGSWCVLERRGWESLWEPLLNYISCLATSPLVPHWPSSFFLSPSLSILPQAALEEIHKFSGTYTCMNTFKGRT